MPSQAQGKKIIFTLFIRNQEENETAVAADTCEHSAGTGSFLS